MSKKRCKTTNNNQILRLFYNMGQSVLFSSYRLISLDIPCHFVTNQLYYLLIQFQSHIPNFHSIKSPQSIYSNFVLYIHLTQHSCPFPPFFISCCIKASGTSAPITRVILLGLMSSSFKFRMYPISDLSEILVGNVLLWFLQYPLYCWYLPTLFFRPDLVSSRYFHFHYPAMHILI